MRKRESEGRQAKQAFGSGNKSFRAAARRREMVKWKLKSTCGMGWVQKKSERQQKTSSQNLNEAMIKRTTPTATRTHNHPCNMPKKKQQQKQPSQKLQRTPKRRKEKKNHFHEIHFEPAKFFVLFIRWASMKLVLFSVVLRALKFEVKQKSWKRKTKIVKWPVKRDNEIIDEREVQMRRLWQASDKWDLIRAKENQQWDWDFTRSSDKKIDAKTINYGFLLARTSASSWPEVLQQMSIKLIYRHQHHMYGKSKPIIN